GDVEACLLEVTLLLGDGVGHAIHAGAEMRNVEFDRLRRYGPKHHKCGGDCRDQLSAHSIPPYPVIVALHYVSRAGGAAPDDKNSCHSDVHREPPRKACTRLSAHEELDSA